MFNFTARFIFTSQSEHKPDSLLVEVRTNSKQKRLYTAALIIPTEYAYKHFSQMLATNRYKIVDCRNSKRDFLVCRIGSKVLKMTEKNFDG